ncbi:MAG: hypothetical protein OEQ25_01235 [Gammaproteobacteria bacterium]|nr:hypothetical protein [Gammaproteobacteria bacterium]MDH3505737.1 hypothetical protein [Gammaproteobacteria bacterium]
MTMISSSLYRRWVIYCTIGELVGFGGIPVLGGAITFSLTAGLAAEPRSMILYTVAVLGGFGEGAVLAWFQLRVLRDCFPGLSARHWIVATAMAAAAAWMLGMLAPTLDDLIGLSTATQTAIWVPASVLILVSIGSAQAWVLSGVVERPRRWITANVLGWLLGLPWTFVLPALLPEDAPVVAWVVTFVIAGVLMGLTVGLVTGRTLVGLVPPRHARCG